MVSQRRKTISGFLKSSVFMSPKPGTNSVDRSSSIQNINVKNNNNMARNSITAVASIGDGGGRGNIVTKDAITTPDTTIMPASPATTPAEDGISEKSRNRNASATGTPVTIRMLKRTDFGSKREWLVYHLKSCLMCKDYDQVMDERDRTELRRDLGLVDLMSFGVGATIGSGIFVLVGVVAAVHTGPAVLISLMISGLCAMLSALSYAELSSMVPVSGASYVYVYISLGELAAWLTVWTLILEFLIGASTVSVGWSSYIVSIFYDAFKVKIPVSISSSPVKWDNSIQKFVKVQGAMFNLPATLIVTILTGIILLGSKQSARINTIITFVKLIVIVVFVFASIQYINRENYAPFVPEQKNGEFGVIGIFKGAQEMFFAYLGFDIISTSAQEARNPQRDMPIAIGVSLTVCVICYCVVSVILTGIAKYTELNTASPISAALAPHKNTRWLRIFVDIGILSGLTSVVLIMLMAQGRMFISVANDGLLPPLFRRINKWSRTPVYSQLIIGGVSAICAGLLPVDILGDLTSLAAILVFLIVHISVIVLRYKHPRAARGFTIPFGLAIPIFGIAISMVLIVLSGKQSIARISIWLGIGILVYLIYGRWHSKLNLIASDAEHKLQENSQSGAGLQKTDTSLAYLKTDELSSGTGSGRTSNIFETFSRGNGPLTKSQVRHPTQEIKVSSPIPI